MFDLHTSLLDSEYGEQLDSERLEKYIHQVMAEFEKSPEAEVILTEFNTSLCWPATSYTDASPRRRGTDR